MWQSGHACFLLRHSCDPSHGVAKTEGTTKEVEPKRSVQWRGSARMLFVFRHVRLNRMQISILHSAHAHLPHLSSVMRRWLRNRISNAARVYGARAAETGWKYGVTSDTRSSCWSAYIHLCKRTSKAGSLKHCMSLGFCIILEKNVNRGVSEVILFIH